MNLLWLVASPQPDIVQFSILAAWGCDNAFMPFVELRLEQQSLAVGLLAVRKLAKRE